MIEHHKIKLNNVLAVVHPSGTKKPVLAKLRATNRGMDAIVQNDKTGSPEEDVYPVEFSEILSLVLNPNPEKVEVVQGVRVEPYHSREKIKGFGHIIYKRALSPAEQRIIHKAISKTIQVLKDNKLGFLLPTSMEVKLNSGAMAGYCKQNFQDQTFTIGLCPKAYVDDGVEGVLRILTHEFVHPVWAFYMDAEQKARWLKLYTTFNQIEDISNGELQNMLSDLSKSESTKDFLADCEDKDKLIFKLVMKWIKQTHRLDVKALNMLLGQQADISSYWPNSVLHLSEMNTETISQYASKNPVEFCCESISKYLCGEDLPEAVRKRVKSTLKQVRPK